MVICKNNLNHDFDILILDLGFNDGDGLDWLIKNQQLSGKGLIIVSARDSLNDKLLGIKAGADAYFTKPAPLEIIAATVHNLFKRISTERLPTWTINPKTWILIAPDKQSLSLTHSEMLLMLRFTKNQEEIIGRDELILSLGHSPEYYDARRLEIMIRRLRKKVFTNFGFNLPIETVHGKGFAFPSPIQLIKL